jgi:multiple sugar transport system substrate-binding protein
MDENIDNNSLPTIQPYTIEPIQEYDAYDPTLYGDNTYTTESSGEAKRRNPMFLVLIILAFLGLMIFGFLLLGGGNGNNNQNNNTTTGNQNTNRNVVLQWWGMFLDKDVVQPLLDKYNAENPNVTIEYANKFSGGDYNTASKNYQEELNRVLKGNDPVQLPDIFMVHNTWAGDYEAYAQESTEYDLTTFTNTFYPAAVTDFANTGEVFGVPLWMDTLAVIYNKDLLNAVDLAEPPANWSRFKNAAQALTKRTGSTINQAGFAAGTTTNTSFYFEMANLLLAQNGVQIVNAQNQPIFSADPDAVDALEFFKSFTTGTEPTWNETMKNDSAAFLEEKVAMVIAPSWRLREILKYNDQLNLNLDIGIAQIPQVEGQTQEIINWADYWGSMVALNRPNAVESWRFLEWITQPEQLKEINNNIKQKYGYFGNLYPRKDMQNELQNDDFLKVYNKSLPFAQTWYMVKGIGVKEEFSKLLTSRSRISSSNLVETENNIKGLQALKGILP